MSTITLEEAQHRLPALIEALRPGEELVIVRNDTPVARLVGTAAVSGTPRQAGSARGKLTLTDQDGEPLDDFAAYMP